MKLVIDIPDYTYEELRDCKGVITIGEAITITQAIKNGTPFPKGHGDLIDRNEARDAMRDMMSGTGYQSMAMDVLNEFYIPTVIEADEEAGDG